MYNVNNDPELKEITSQTTKHTYQGQTSWTDHIHKHFLNISNPRNELQPQPDYMRWYETCEQHYNKSDSLKYYSMAHEMMCLAFTFLSVTH